MLQVDSDFLTVPLIRGFCGPFVVLGYFFQFSSDLTLSVAKNDYFAAVGFVKTGLDLAYFSFLMRP